jgi:hypothetical protein
VRGAKKYPFVVCFRDRFNKSATNEQSERCARRYIYDHFDWDHCDPTTASPVEAAADAFTTGYDGDNASEESMFTFAGAPLDCI